MTCATANGLLAGLLLILLGGGQASAADGAPALGEAPLSNDTERLMDKKTLIWSLRYDSNYIATANIVALVPRDIYWVPGSSFQRYDYLTWGCEAVVGLRGSGLNLVLAQVWGDGFTAGHVLGKVGIHRTYDHAKMIDDDGTFGYVGLEGGKRMFIYPFVAEVGALIGDGDGGLKLSLGVGF